MRFLRLQPFDPSSGGVCPGSTGFINARSLSLFVAAALLGAVFSGCGAEDTADPADRLGTEESGYNLSRDEEFRQLSVVTQREDLPPAMRAFAVRLLGGYQDFPEALNLLTEHLADPDASIVVAAIGGLRELAKPGAVPALKALSSHSAPTVVAAAREAVKSLEATP